MSLLITRGLGVDRTVLGTNLDYTVSSPDYGVIASKDNYSADISVSERRGSVKSPSYKVALRK